ncbi:hypothetical protein HMPREF1554_00263 [Porphyromonas gingivalis F0569]|nr:hypothetical protein HMPREF1554_00263 [Porphyromonas gingivalis F0569]
MQLLLPDSSFIQLSMRLNERVISPFERNAFAPIRDREFEKKRFEM